MTFDETLFADVLVPRLGGLFVTVAAKLYARTGAWPPWFLRALRADGEHVPRGYVMLALHYRRELEHELGLELPVHRRPAPAGSKQAMAQLEIESITRTPGSEVAARSAATGHATSPPTRHPGAQRGPPRRRGAGRRRCSGPHGK